MSLWEAALWGLAGGGAVAVLSFMTAVKNAGYRWPWHKKEQLGPRLFVLAGGLVLGALVSAAAHGQISGPWPAFIFGIGAPATIRGFLSGVEVTARGVETPGIPAPAPAPDPAAASEEVSR